MDSEAEEIKTKNPMASDFRDDSLKVFEISIGTSEDVLDGECVDEDVSMDDLTSKILLSSRRILKSSPVQPSQRE